MKTFYDYTEQDARLLLTSFPRFSVAYRALQFYKGNHLHSRDEWRGPQPTGPKAEEMWREIIRGFVSKNVTKEVVERHTFGVLGREPMWSFDGTRKRRPRAGEAQATVADRLNDLLIPWWDARRILLKMREATANLLLTGKGHLRLYVPPGTREVHLTVPEPGQACVHTDPVTQRQIAVYEYKTKEGEAFVEVSFLNDEGLTVIRTLKGTDRNAVVDAFLKFFGVAREEIASEAVVDLGGHLHVYEMSREPLIDEQFLQNQCLLNMALTMLPRNVVLGGFLERIMLNVQKPKKRQLKAGSTTEYEEVETDEMATGPAATTFATGVPRYDKETGELIGYESPSVVFRDPIAVKTFEDTGRIAYETMLDQSHQKHVVITGAGNELDELRKQARDDYEKSLLLTKGEGDAAGRWILEAPGRLLATFAGQAELFSGLRASFDSRIDVGPLNSEEIRMMQEEVAKELMSRQTYMNRRGADDPDGELALIAADTSLSALKMRLEIAQLARNLGLDDKFRELTGLTAGTPLPQLPPAGEGEGEGAVN